MASNQSQRSEFQEILTRLDRIENGRPPVIPLIDPTANVIALTTEKERRQDDLRNTDRMWRDRLDAQTEKWRDKLDAERQRADANASKAEAGRLDALLLANTNNVALALAKQEAVTQEQARRLAVLEQNQYQAGGVNIQRTEQRGQSNVDRSLIVSIVLAAGAIAAAVIYHH
jgi:hypothetical protein